MIIGLLVLVTPTVVYLFTFSLSVNLVQPLCWIYRIFGGVIAIIGSLVSLYFAAYSGDQGGITAFYFQIVVILVYILFLFIVIIANVLARKSKGVRNHG